MIAQALLERRKALVVKDTAADEEDSDSDWDWKAVRFDAQLLMALKQIKSAFKFLGNPSLCRPNFYFSSILYLFFKKENLILFS